MEFPYLKKTTDAGIFLTPYCWIEVLTYRFVWRKVKFLFDTGADYTTLPKFMSRTTGVDIAKSKEKIMYTANNEPMV